MQAVGSRVFLRRARSPWLPTSIPFPTVGCDGRTPLPTRRHDRRLPSACLGPVRRPQPFLDSDPALAPLRRSFSIQDLAVLAADAGVCATVVVQTVTEPAETAELLALAQTEPLVAAVVGWTDLTAPTVSEAVAQLRAMPGGNYLACVGHPLLTESDADWIGRSEVIRGLHAWPQPD